MSSRADLELIARLVPSHARVLDLGCEDGKLLKLLAERKHCRVYGVEIALQHLLACTSKGLSVLQLDLEHGLRLFSDQSFDVVLQLDTLQNLKHTERALMETVRVGKLGIVSIPNFAYWRIRARVLTGRLPITSELPYEWFNTPNVRVTTFVEFERLINKLGLTIHESFGICRGKRRDWFPNMFASFAVFCISKK